jgi:hypothetical protein
MRSPCAVPQLVSYQFIVEKFVEEYQRKGAEETQRKKERTTGFFVAFLCAFALDVF